MTVLHHFKRVVFPCITLLVIALLTSAGDMVINMTLSELFLTVVLAILIGLLGFTLLTARLISYHKG